MADHIEQQSQICPGCFVPRVHAVTQAVSCVDGAAIDLFQSHACFLICS